MAAAAGIELAGLGHVERAAELGRSLSRRGAATLAADVRSAIDYRRLTVLVAQDVQVAQRALETNDPGQLDLLLRRIFETHPDNAAAHLLAGRAAMRAGQLDRARMHLGRVLAHGTPGQRSTAQNNLGIIEMRQGNAAAGRAAFEAARALQPGSTTSYLNLARLDVQHGRFDTARSVLQDGLRRAYPPGPIEQALLELLQEH